jgi:hypothetical protein
MRVPRRAAEAECGAVDKSRSVARDEAVIIDPVDDAAPGTFGCLTSGLRAEAGRNQPDETFHMKSLILAQNERWRQGLGMQVARESRKVSTVA